MKLFCPYCGLKGTAKDSLYNKKVNCPDCEKPFTLDCAVIAGPHQKTTAAFLPQDNEIAEAVPAENHPHEIVQELETTDKRAKEEAANLETAVENEHQFQARQICSSCGANIEEGAEYRSGNKIYCNNCIPMAEERSLEKITTPKKNSGFFASLFSLKRKNK